MPHPPGMLANAVAERTGNDRGDLLVSEKEFVDHYEVLQLSQGADTEALERIFRLLAKCYHPDNPESGNEERFREIHDAYEILRDPARRAGYDVLYDKHKSMQWQVFDQDAAPGDTPKTRRSSAGSRPFSTLRVERTRNTAASAPWTWRGSWEFRASTGSFRSGT